MSSNSSNSSKQRMYCIHFQPEDSQYMPKRVTYITTQQQAEAAEKEAADAKKEVADAKDELLWLKQRTEELISRIAVLNAISAEEEQMKEVCDAIEAEEVLKEGDIPDDGTMLDVYSEADPPQEVVEERMAADAAEAEQMHEAAEAADAAKKAENHARTWADVAMPTQAAYAAKNAEDAEDAENDARKRALDVWLNDQMKNNPRFRRQLCKNWDKYSKCPHGSLCLYAHGEEQLQRPETYKTVICRGWLNDCCEYGAGCNYAHGNKELRCRPCA